MRMVRIAFIVGLVALLSLFDPQTSFLLSPDALMILIPGTFLALFLLTLGAALHNAKTPQPGVEPKSS